MYTYKCDKCGEDFDTFLSMNDRNKDDGETCRMPNCDGKLKRQMNTGQRFSMKGNFTASNNYGLRGKK